MATLSSRTIFIGDHERMTCEAGTAAPAICHASQQKLNFEPCRMRFFIVHQLQRFQAPHSKRKKLMNPQVGSLLLLLLSIFTIIVWMCFWTLARRESQRAIYKQANNGISLRPKSSPVFVRRSVSRKLTLRVEKSA